MSEIINEILLRRKNKLTVISQLDNENVDNIEVVLMFTKNINSLGYTFSKPLINKLRTLTTIELKTYHDKLIPLLRKYVGADKEYNPMYPNFPLQVKEADDFELLVNAFIHYLSYGAILPEYEKEERLPLLESHDLKVIDLADDNDEAELLTNLISSKTSLSDQDKEDMIVLFNKNIPLESLPDVIPFKENVSIITKLIYESTMGDTTFRLLNHYLKTATDILRFCVCLSDGDVSLSKAPKFKHFNRPTRNLILHLIHTASSFNLEDMNKYRGYWLRLGEILHPSEPKMAEKYSLADSYFFTLRNNEQSIESFQSSVNNALENGKISDAVKLLSTRSGEFARQLDRVLRTCKSTPVQFFVVNSFAMVADRVALPTLFQLEKYYQHNRNNEYRIFTIKNDDSTKLYTKENNLTPFPSTLTEHILTVLKSAIGKIISDKPFLNKVYVSDSILGYCIPQSQRTASTSLRPTVRGSRFKISDTAKAIRAFIWWTNCKDGDIVDIDLSAVYVDVKCNYISDISYINLRDKGLQSFHSGDITNGGKFGGKGVSEFIDVAIDKSIENKNIRYILFQLYSFNGQRFSELQGNLSFGIMERDSVYSGEIYEPTTVIQRMDVTSNSTVCTPIAYDVKTKEFIWLDIDKSSPYSFCNNVHTNFSTFSGLTYAFINNRKPLMYDVAMTHAMNRGILVEDRNEADVIFDIDTTLPLHKVTEEIPLYDADGNYVKTDIVEKLVENKDARIITPFDIDIWMAEMI